MDDKDEPKDRVVGPLVENAMIWHQLSAIATGGESFWGEPSTWTRWDRDPRSRPAGPTSAIDSKQDLIRSFRDYLAAGSPAFLEHTNTALFTHDTTACHGQVCPVHRRTQHHMRGMAQSWNETAQKMARECSHGIRHPDPDDPKGSWLHQCDGCCAAPEETITYDEEMEETMHAKDIITQYLRDPAWVDEALEAYPQLTVPGALAAHLETTLDGLADRA